VYHVRGREGEAGGFDARQEEYNKLNFLTVYVYKTRQNFKNFVLLNFLRVYVYKTRRNFKNLVLLSLVLKLMQIYLHLLSVPGLKDLQSRNDRA
jgi:hypothetical protein